MFIVCNDFFRGCVSSLERGVRVHVHYVVDPSELAHAALHRFLETFYPSYVDVSKPKNFRSVACGGNVFRHALGLGDIAADDTGVGAEVDEGADLG